MRKEKRKQKKSYIQQQYLIKKKEKEKKILYNFVGVGALKNNLKKKTNLL